jgi:hypothetical protein
MDLWGVLDADVDGNDDCVVRVVVTVGGVWVVASFSVAFRMHATVADADLLRVNES